MSTVKPIPDGFTSLTPHLVVKGAEKAIEFYKSAFNAQEICRSHHEGKLMHAELKIGNSILMLNDEFPEMGALSPASLGGSGVTLHLYVEDVDSVFNRAVSSGATVGMPVGDMFWGDRYGMLVDPFGHRWAIATHKQDLSPEELEKAAQKALAEHCK
jgi:PhnB protein